ncbi:MAG: hypothetical protein Q4B61_04940 [Bacteroidales bacterium]|jgi:hypothetical protein|nr:hypothetical protein [Bacteroidales bacterium]
MTVAEMKISNRERLDKLEALDPEKLNDILDYVFSKLVSMPNGEEEKKSKSDISKIQDKEELPSYFGIWKDNGDEIKELIYKSRTKNQEVIL